MIEWIRKIIYGNDRPVDSHRNVRQDYRCDGCDAMIVQYWPLIPFRCHECKSSVRKVGKPYKKNPENPPSGIDARRVR